MLTAGRLYFLLLLLPLITVTKTSSSGNSDPLSTGSGSLKRTRYILYDVNPGEGFNLRRDVYMRMAVFVKKLNKSFPNSYWVLVLPPWGHLYHWQSRALGHQVLGFLKISNQICFNQRICYRCGSRGLTSLTLPHLLGTCRW